MAKQIDSPVVPDAFDARLRRRNLSRGIITREELKKHLDALPDLGHLADEIPYGELVSEPIEEAPVFDTKPEPTPIEVQTKPSFEIPQVIPAIEIPSDLLFKVRNAGMSSSGEGSGQNNSGSNG